MRSRYTSVAVLACLMGAVGAPAPPDAVVEVAGTTQTFELVGVPAGVLGDDHVDAFWISRNEVSWDLFDIFIYGLDEKDDDTDEEEPNGADAVTRPSKPYISMDRGFGHRGYPAISMSYKSAEAFCVWLSTKTGDHYRLPTEQEWRLACELGGVTPDELDDHAWHDGNADYKTHPVGRKAPDDLGLHDMYGNAREWCTGADGHPVTIGGSYKDKAEGLGCSGLLAPSDDWNASDPQLPKSVWWLADAGFVGFRVVRVPNGGEETAHDSDR